VIRLHKHAAYLTASDEEAWAELAGLESLRSAIGPPIAPTIAWVDHHRVAVLREALRQAGYLPRVATDGTPPAEDSGG
jgi:hypothetical protein